MEPGARWYLEGQRHIRGQGRAEELRSRLGTRLDDMGNVRNVAERTRDTLFGIDQRIDDQLRRYGSGRAVPNRGPCRVPPLQRHGRPDTREVHRRT